MYNAKIITISPIHIGDGEELIPLEYIEGKTEVKVYPFYYLIDKLYEKYEDKIETIAPLLKMFAKKGELSKLEDFFSNLGVHLEPKYVLSKEVPVNGKKIKTFIKNTLGPYIPGSEIKGALRTVFLFGVLKENEILRNDFYKILERKIREANTKNQKKEKVKILEKAIEEIELLVFRAGKNNDQKDAQYDIFKALQISDSESLNYDYLFISSVKVLNSSREIRDYCEFLKPGKKINITIKLDENALEGLKSLKIFNKRLEIKNLEKLAFKFLKESAINFYESLIKEDENFIEKKVQDLDVKKDLKNKLNKLKEFLTKIKNSSKIIIPLRLGKHQGYLSTTIMQIVKKEKPDLFEKVFRISVPKERPEVNKTRKILDPESTFPGWCFLHIED